MIIDEIDQKLISLLQQNARFSLKQLAQEVYLSSPAVSSRIERLEKMGIITGYQAQLDHQKLGYHITAFINLAMDPGQKPVFYPFITACPNVIECSCVHAAEGGFPQHPGAGHLYRGDSKIREHQDPDCLFHRRPLPGNYVGKRLSLRR